VFYTQTTNPPPYFTTIPKIIATGVQEDAPGSIRPVLWSIESPDRRSAYVARSHFARAGPTSKVMIDDTPDGWLNENERKELEGSIGGRKFAVDVAEEAAVSAIRSVANRCNAVGGDCMSVAIYRREGPLEARVRFIPEHAHTAIFAPGESSPIAYSPWIIGPGVAAAPALLIGSSQVRSGPITIYREAPSSVLQGVSAVMQSHDRPVPLGWMRRDTGRFRGS
jgi:hypothetical protein